MGITFYNNNCSKPIQDVKKAVYIHFCKRNIKLYSSFTEIKWELAQTSSQYPSYLKIMSAEELLKYADRKIIPILFLCLIGVLIRMLLDFIYL